MQLQEHLLMLFLFSCGFTFRDLMDVLWKSSFKIYKNTLSGNLWQISYKYNIYFYSLQSMTLQKKVIIDALMIKYF